MTSVEGPDTRNLTPRSGKWFRVSGVRYGVSRDECECICYSEVSDFRCQGFGMGDTDISHHVSRIGFQKQLRGKYLVSNQTDKGGNL